MNINISKTAFKVLSCFLIIKDYCIGSMELICAREDFIVRAASLTQYLHGMACEVINRL